MIMIMIMIMIMTIGCGDDDCGAGLDCAAQWRNLNKISTKQGLSPELVITKEQQSAKIVLLRFKILKSENEFNFLKNWTKS